jgi:uncharacterized membrane protein
VKDFTAYVPENHMRVEDIVYRRMRKAFWKTATIVFGPLAIILVALFFVEKS